MKVVCTNIVIADINIVSDVTILHEFVVTNLNQPGAVCGDCKIANGGQQPDTW